MSADTVHTTVPTTDNAEAIDIADSAAVQVTDKSKPATKARQRKTAGKAGSGQSRTTAKAKLNGKAKPPAAKTVRRRSVATDTMDTLHHEHQHVDKLLAAMEEQLELLEPGQSADYALLQDMMHYFCSFPDRFHHPREDVVFRFLIERDRRFLGYVKQLEADHIDMKADGLILLEKIKDICQQGVCNEPERLKVQLQDYVDFYRMHMNLEESKVFPGIRQALTKSDWNAVDKELQQQGDPLFGDIVKARYQGVSDYIESLEHEADDDVVVSSSPWRALSRSVAIAGSGIKEMNRVCRQRSRLGWAGNKRALERALDKDEADKLSDLPSLVMKRNMMHISEGFSDVRAIAKATRERLANKGNGKKRGKAFKRG